MEDIRIIELFFERSESAIDETRKKYGAYLGKIAYNIIENDDDASEIVSDTYLAAWNTIPPQKPESFRHYLAQITRNLSFKRIEYIRARKRSGNACMIFSELEECIPDSMSDIVRITEAKQTGETINRFLHTLTKEDCALFVSRYFYTEPIDTIAGKYSMTPRHVKYRLSVLRKELKETLEKEGL